MVTNSEAGNAADLASKPQASGSRMRRCATAALAGAIPWSIYGIVEVVFVAIVPWVIHGTVNLPIVGWAYGVALLAIYPLAGAMLTAAVAAPTCLMRQKNTAAQDAGLWTAIGLLLLTLAAAASVVAAEQQHAEPGVAVACVFAAWRVRAEWRGHGSRIDFVANPWACALLIVGCAYLAEPRSSYGYIEAGIMLAAGLLVAVIGGAAASWIARRTISRARNPWAVLASASAVLAGVTWLVVDAPRLPAAAPSQGSENHLPNVILIVLDTVRADHLSVYGYERDTTPVLRGLVENGATVFTAAVSASNMSLSGHASLFTGLYASRHGARQFTMGTAPGELPTSVPTLAMMLRNAGYGTVGVAANASGYLGPAFGLDRGFEYYDNRPSLALQGLSKPYYLRTTIWRAAQLGLRPTDVEVSYRPASEITDEVTDLVERAARPFFLFVNYMDAHTPLIPPEPFASRFPGRNPSFTSRALERIRDEVLDRRRSIDVSERNHLISQYDGGIAYLDSELGRLLARLRALGIYDSSLVIVTSDHGEAFGSRQIIGHAFGLYSNEIHVPLIVKWPGQRFKRRVTTPVSSVDVLPTVLSVVGRPIPRDVDGLSLDQAAAQEDRIVFSESFPFPFFTSWSDRFDRRATAVIGRRFKLIDSGDADTTDPGELYDLLADPQERVNVVQAHPEAVAALRAALAQFSARAAHAEPPRTLDRDERERLRSLGYTR